METAASANHNDHQCPSNQPNRQRSTGPKTEAGKRVSAQNAVKFGFFSTKALLPGESAEEFTEFQAAVQQQLAPRNAMEAHVVEQYVPLAWRLRRLPEIEASAFTRYGISVQGNQCGPGFALVASVQSDNILGQLARYEATLRKVLSSTWICCGRYAGRAGNRSPRSSRWSWLKSHLQARRQAPLMLLRWKLKLRHQRSRNRTPGGVGHNSNPRMTEDKNYDQPSEPRDAC